MSIKKEIDRAVKLTAALNGNTTPKTPAEQDQIVLTVEEAVRNSAFNFNNATSAVLSQDGKKRLVKRYTDLYSPEHILCQCIKQILDRTFKVRYPNRNKISHDLFATLTATIQMADFTIVKFDFKDYFNSISSIYVFEKYLRSNLTDRHEIDLIKAFVYSTKRSYAGLCTSNAIAEIIATHFDKAIRKKFSSNGVIYYERYIDDCVLVLNEHMEESETKDSHLFITIDRILQNINGRSSNGIVVGPEFSRMMAEILLQHIDNEILLELEKDGIFYKVDYAAFRYVDDIFLFSNQPQGLEQILSKYKTIGEHYRLRINELKLTKGTTPCLPKEWLEKTRQLSDIIGDFFYQGKKSDYENLPEEDRYIVKNDFISVDRIKDEIAVLVKKYPDDRRTIVSFLLSTLLNNISKKKSGYTLFGKKRLGKALLLLDIALYIYAFYPSFDQTRKVISIVAYLNSEVDFKHEEKAKEKLSNTINRILFSNMPLW